MFQVISIIGAIYLAATVTSIARPQELIDHPKALSSDSAGQLGLKVVIDPATGKILENPTAEELRSIGSSQAISVPRRSSWELRSFPLPGGGEGVALDEWAHHSLTLRRAENGEFLVQCAQGDVHGAPKLSRQGPVEDDR